MTIVEAGASDHGRCRHASRCACRRGARCQRRRVGRRVVPDDPGRVSRRCTSGWRVRARWSGSGSKAPAPTAPAWPVICAATASTVIEVDRPNRQARRRNGKSDRLDAVEAARAALSGRARGVAKTADGNVEAIRALLVAKRSGRDDAHQVPQPDPPSRLHRPRRAAGTASGACPATTLARRGRRAAPTAAATRSRYATKLALAHPRPPRRRPRRRDRPPRHAPRRRSSTPPRPSLLELYGVGVDTAAILLVAAGDNAERHPLRSRLGAPLRRRPDPRRRRARPTRHRLNRGGNRQANHALVADRVHPHELTTTAPAPTSNAASPKDAPSPRSSASSSATSPARSTATSHAH